MSEVTGYGGLAHRSWWSEAQARDGGSNSVRLLTCLVVGAASLSG